MSGHNGNHGSTIRSALNDDQRETLTRLETVQQPSEWDKGALRALRLCGGQADRERAERLRDRWGTT